ncbi:MAG: altronate dehydratase [Rubellimicrobium sp.]|nr:altronate dehydratase [Rubellimicrobium sp.]
MTAPRYIRLDPADNLVVALANLPEGEMVEGVTLTARVPRGHKIATRAIAPGENLLRYGQIIGVATRPVAPGDHVHSHNLGMGAHDTDYAHATEAQPLSLPVEAREFMGHARGDGQVGTRNYLGILTSVNCSGSVARFIADEVERQGWLADYPNIDGVVPIAHGMGCGMSNRDEGYATLMRTIRGYARNPNFGAVLLVGLGCEVMQVPDIIAEGALRGDGLFRTMTIQEEGGTRRTVERGVAMLREMAPEANRARRAPAPVSALCVALQCGGSDGYSGITANPALGHASDLLVAHGGTTILAETPEIYGAEHLLTRRAVSRAVGEKLVARIRWWENYTAARGAEMDNNPSPGNKLGGLTTILEKSLGAAAKGGRAPLSDVLLYGEPAREKGFLFMDSPGYDPVSVTGQVASGANLVCFTTGRGSVSGYKPVPCVKLATNSEMFAHMSEDMDINCGDIVSDGVTLEEKGREIFETWIRVASGQATKSETLGFGGAEFVPWNIGAVM